MQIEFYASFAKKVNSTKAPLASTVTKTLTGYLIEPCSIMNPTFKIERFASDASPQSYTYAYIGEFARFYFVEDWSWADGLWLCKLKEDVLASFKTQIGNSTEYVLRTDSTTNFNGEITDTTYPATTDIDTRIFENASPFVPDNITSGVYIVGIISGEDDYSVGAITYYIMSSSEFDQLKDKLFTDDNLEIMGIINSSGQQIVQDLSKEVLKTLYNPYQYIASCIWYPISVSDIADKEQVTEIKLGWWTYNIICYRLETTSINISEVNIALPSHPQSALRGSYLNYAPYTKRTLYGKFGTLPLDTALFADGDYLSISYRVDVITGQCRATFIRKRNNALDFINQKEFMLGVPIQIAQVGTDYLGATATSISTGAVAAQQALTLNYGGMIATFANGIYDTIKTAMPQLETSGTNGSFLGSSNTTKMITMFYQIVDEDIEHRGRPLCELKQLNTLSGFILCAEGEIDLNCFDNERKEILHYLTTGFFME